jgi:hypothetical protein
MVRMDPLGRDDWPGDTSCPALRVACHHMRLFNWTFSTAAAVACNLLLMSVVLLPASAAPQDAPDGLLATSPAQASSGRGALLGFNDHPLQGRAPADPNVMLDRLVGLGGGFVRIDVHWPWFEPVRAGRANWSADQVTLLDRYLDAARARGIEVELAVLGTPCWAAAGPQRACDEREREASQTAEPRNPEEFADFVGALVKFAGGRVQYVGIGNEPNHPAFAAAPDPAAYTRVLRASFARIKAIDPSVAVVAGALAPGSPGGARLNTLEYLDGMYRAGAGDAFDYLEFHSYTDGHSADWADPQYPLMSFPQSVPAFRAVMTAHNDDRPIILGEIGWTTVNSGACSDCGAMNLGVSPETQADNLALALDVASQWPYVHKLVVYELVDHGPPDSTSQYDHFGVLQRDLRAKPAANALAQQVATLRQASSPV